MAHGPQLLTTPLTRTLLMVLAVMIQTVVVRYLQCGQAVGVVEPIELRWHLSSDWLDEAAIVVPRRPSRGIRRRIGVAGFGGRIVGRAPAVLCVGGD